MALRHPATYISVCSGVGGLDLGLHEAAGLEPVVYIEREAHSAAVLVARMEEEVIPRAPVWDDIRTFDARKLVGLVDCVVGGTPCQDLSLAGKRAGLDGERGRLFFEHVRIASECRASFVFWENVAGAASAVPSAAEYLASHGYAHAVWCVVRASDVGAPHSRARVFLLAHADGMRELQPQGGKRHERGRASDLCSGVGRFPPRPEDSAGWERVLTYRPDLAPATPQPRFRGLADGLGARVDVCVCPREDRLRAAGNGVVPQQAALAWRILWRALAARYH